MAKMKSKRTTTESLLVNVGQIDVVTGTYYKGKYGENILIGGLDSVFVIMGPGNSYKSTILHHFTLTAANRITASLTDKQKEELYITSFDTEMNMKFARLQSFLDKNEYLDPMMLQGMNPKWLVLTKADTPADIWVSDFRDYVFERAKEKQVEFTAFKNPYTGETYKALIPNFGQIDSMAEFETSTSMDMLAKAKKDNNDTATYYLKDGLFKSKFIGELPRLTRISNMYLGYVTHTGESKGIGENKYAPPEKQNQYLKGDTKIKGGTSKTNYLTLLSFYANTAVSLKNKTTKLPEYPRSEVEEYDTDLNLVRLTLLRSKSGPSGAVTELVVSQDEGVLDALSSFRYIKVSQNNFGIIGNDRNYSVVFMPELSLRRTNVRTLLDTNEKLQRAVEILERLKKMTYYMSYYNRLMVSPEELYQGLIEKGYDWNILLNSRGWWTVDNYTDKLKPYLSELDLLLMYHGQYHPYWLEDDKKTVKKKWIKHFDNLTE